MSVARPSTAAYAAASVLSLSGWTLVSSGTKYIRLSWKDFELLIDSGTGLISLPQKHQRRFDPPSPGDCRPCEGARGSGEGGS